jgi:triphosphoribosyl-dephospho-CoA synthase
VAATNTNLGIILLLAPLAAVPADEDLRPRVNRVLSGLDVDDARLAYEAIRLANPGGLGAAPEQDVAAEPTCTLREAMELAAGRDMVARQYANGFREVFDDAVPALAAGLEKTGTLEGAIIHTQLCLMARHPDTLIARKRGESAAAEAGLRAARVLAAGWPEQAAGQRELASLDEWLRQDGHTRNPGATADVVTAGLFAALRLGILRLPVRQFSLGK